MAKWKLLIPIHEPWVQIPARMPGVLLEFWWFSSVPLRAGIVYFNYAILVLPTLFQNHYSLIILSFLLYRLTLKSDYFLKHN